MTKATRLTNQVKRYRQLQNLTQEQLAEKLNVSRQTLIAIENGKYSPSLEFALSLSRILQAKLDDLFQLPE